jgi:hypothetical protein
MNSNGPVARRAGDQGAFQIIGMHAFGLYPAFREVLLHRCPADEKVSGQGEPSTSRMRSRV